MKQSTRENGMYNALTIDVEDYFMVSAFSDVIKFEDWHKYESRVEKNTYRILDLLNESGVKATFFILGWVGENYPEMVGDIHSMGHEIACHGYNHRLIYDLSPDEFREDIRRSKDILEDIAGEPVVGFRAASYSIVKGTLWALDILIEEGFLYDSSIFPIHHDRYGLPDSDRFPHVIRRDGGSILEFPPSTCRILRLNIPVAGGGYLRLSPSWILKTAVKRINEREKRPFILYLHPWEIDVDQPRLNGRRLSMIRHYINLDSTMPKLKMFLEEFRFEPLSSILLINRI
jgi:polysaccharide deacetylase family protein (PEP-CTERM system associated)